MDVNLNMLRQKEEVKLNFLCLIQKRWEEIMFSLFVYRCKGKKTQLLLLLLLLLLLFQHDKIDV